MALRRVDDGSGSTMSSGIAISTDGRWLAVLIKPPGQVTPVLQLQIFNVRTGELLRRLDTSKITRFGRTFQGHAFSTDGSRFGCVRAASSQFCVWDLSTGRRILALPLQKHFDPIRDVLSSVLNFDGSIAAVLTSKGKLLVVDVKTGRILTKSSGLRKKILDSVDTRDDTITFSPDGALIAVKMADTKSRNSLSYRIHVFNPRSNQTVFETLPKGAQRAGRDAYDEGIVLDDLWGKPLFWKVIRNKRAMRALAKVLVDTSEQPGASCNQSSDGRFALFSWRLPGRIRQRTPGYMELWDTVVGRPLLSFAVDGWCFTHFPRDGRRLFVLEWKDRSAPKIVSAIVLDLTLLGKKRRKFSTQIRALWKTLGTSDRPADARRAVFELATHGSQAVKFLAREMTPDRRLAEIGGHLTKLNADKFALRQAATQSLRKLGSIAEPSLRLALANPRVTPEVARRIQALLDQLPAFVEDPQLLQQLRAVHVLERIASPEARHLLKQLCQRGETSQTASAARAAMRRTTLQRSLQITANGGSVRAGTRRKPARARRPISALVRGPLRTYRFTAKILSNGGVTPFKPGTKITGEFTYDRSASDLNPKSPHFGRYESSRNRMIFRYGEQVFKVSGRIMVSTGHYRRGESFSIVAHNLTLPKGWKFIAPPGARKDTSQSFGIMLQNYPTLKVLKSDRIPESLNLSNFVDTRELRFDFAYGVRFPNGVSERRSTIRAWIEKLELSATPKKHSPAGND